jgi:hypothetical protein
VDFRVAASRAEQHRAIVHFRLEIPQRIIARHLADVAVIILGYASPALVIVADEACGVACFRDAPGREEGAEGQRDKTETRLPMVHADSPVQQMVTFAAEDSGTKPSKQGRYQRPSDALASACRLGCAFSTHPGAVARRRLDQTISFISIT